MLVVNEFAIKHVINKDAEHLLNVPKDHYIVEIDWTDRLYWQITLDWNYKDRYIEFFIPGYIKSNYKNMNKSKKDHIIPNHNQEVEKTLQDHIAEDTTKEPSKTRKSCLTGGWKH